MSFRGHYFLNGYHRRIFRRDRNLHSGDSSNSDLIRRGDDVTIPQIGLQYLRNEMVKFRNPLAIHKNLDLKDGAFTEIGFAGVGEDDH